MCKTLKFDSVFDPVFFPPPGVYLNEKIMRIYTILSIKMSAIFFPYNWQTEMPLSIDKGWIK